MKQVKDFTVIIEKDEDGYFVGSVPALPGCHTQGKSMEELLANVKEAIELYLESTEAPREKFVGIRQVQVSA